MQSDRRGWESRVNEGLRLGYCAGLDDSCDNYHVVYYNLMLNIRFDKVYCLTKHFKDVLLSTQVCVTVKHTTRKMSHL